MITLLKNVAGAPEDRGKFVLYGIDDKGHEFLLEYPNAPALLDALLDLVDQAVLMMKDGWKDDAPCGPIPTRLSDKPQ
jgi:hypothetical protein